jgi:hypothetical protein
LTVIVIECESGVVAVGIGQFGHVAMQVVTVSEGGSRDSVVVQWIGNGRELDVDETPLRVIGAEFSWDVP